MTTTYIYDDPTTSSSESFHWQGLSHEPNDRLIKDLDELKELFRASMSDDASAGSLVVNTSDSGGKEESTREAAGSDADDCNTKEEGEVMALWSCILGYCEALATHKNSERRYCLYPIPIDALRRLVNEEVLTSLNTLDVHPGSTNHRAAARSVANSIWSAVVSKTNVKDEVHANSMYIYRRGRLDNKSLDCFGAALCTVIGLKCLGYKSMLTLSEDHAYESHVDDESDKDREETIVEMTASDTAHEKFIEGRRANALATCEVAIPGNTKAQQSKRGREIRETFKDSTLTPRTSWLYMGQNPVLCDSMQMTIAAALANVNCSIESKSSRKDGSLQLSSGPLYDLKRELLWILKDFGYLSSFPFALIELGDCEENRTSERGEQWIEVVEVRTDAVLTIEALYHEAIAISRSLYSDGQVYPYCYPGHYHKDGGQEGSDQEYRLVESLRCYAEASRAASAYVYEWGDSLQLTKVMTKLSEFIVHEVLSSDQGSSPRQWLSRENAVAAGTWVLAFFDSLLLWEERTGTRFLPILTGDNKSGISKALSLLPHDIRCDAIAKALPTDQAVKMGNRGASLPVTSSELQYFTYPRSKRLSTSKLLLSALKRNKVSIGDLELAIVEEASQDGGRSKRARRSKSR